MTVHITNINGMSSKSVAQIAQNQVAEIANRELGFDVFSIYNYNYYNESAEARRSRFDGIIASLSNNDTVIFQSPSWNNINWDTLFIDHLSLYSNIKKIIFIEDFVPLMFETNFYLLPDFISFYNKADLLIVPSKQMYDYLRTHGLKDIPFVVQGFWDHLSKVSQSITPQNTKLINFAGKPQKKFDFIKNWKSAEVKLQVYADEPETNNNPNIVFTGWQEDTLLLELLRRSGGFGLVWSEDPNWSKYMTMNATYKLSTYLAAGIPIIVPPYLAVSNVIKDKNLGIIANSLDEAVEKVKMTSDIEYKQMIENIDTFAQLIRNGYFAKKALIDAVFKVHYQ